MPLPAPIGPDARLMLDASQLGGGEVIRTLSACAEDISATPRLPVFVATRFLAPTRSTSAKPTAAARPVAARYGVTVCPHAGRVSLREMVPRHAVFDHLAIGTTLERRMIGSVNEEEHDGCPDIVAFARHCVGISP
jgi:hypothetical protein